MGGVHEHHDASSHIDHAVKRAPKTTQLGLAPVFEMLPEEAQEEEGTARAPRKPTPPPPPPASRKPAPAPMFHEDEAFEPELARMLEGPATLLAPAPASHGMPAWIQVLLLVTVLAGLGVFGWQLWLRSSPDAVATSEAEGKKGPITGPVNGLEARRRSGGRKRECTGESPMGSVAAAPKEAADPVADEPVAVEPKAKAKPEAKPASAEPAAKKPTALAVPTQSLPRDPAKASDVLVHRALPMIRSGDLRLAEATLDRAWELDPKNPQAMAGYAKLYIAKKEGERAAKWAKKAVRKRSRRAEYHILYGDALAATGRDGRGPQGMAKSAVDRSG